MSVSEVIRLKDRDVPESIFVNKMAAPMENGFIGTITEEEDIEAVPESSDSEDDVNSDFMYQSYLEFQSMVPPNERLS